MFGLGLRPAHYQEILASQPDVDWFECITEDFIDGDKASAEWLDKIRAQHPISFHGVSLSIGSMDPLNQKYLSRLKKLIDRTQPLWVSDHFCWTGVNKINLHDLMPLPYTIEAVDHLVSRIRQVQDFLGCQILLENVSSYLTFSESDMTEWAFISEVVQQADCFILLDINNIYVNAFNQGFSTDAYLKGIPVDRVKQFHLSGHKHCKTHIIDTHDDAVVPKVWDLYQHAVKRFGSVPVIIERDGNIPPLLELLSELAMARKLSEQILCP